jgi:hypothetical protein
MVVTAWVAPACLKGTSKAQGRDAQWKELYTLRHIKEDLESDALLIILSDGETICKLVYFAVALEGPCSSF